MITYCARLDVPMELLRFVTRLLILERRRRCTPAGSRTLTCREQAVMILRRFRDRTRVEQLGRDHGISRATAYRYVDEGTEVLAARAPDLHEALERAREEGTPFVILDGKLFSTDRLDEQVTSVKSPGGSQELAPDNQARNSLLRGLRFQGERGFALLTQRWALLQHTTASPRQLTQIVRAALVLTQFEHKYIRLKSLRSRHYVVSVGGDESCAQPPAGICDYLDHRWTDFVDRVGELHGSFVQAVRRL